MWNEDRRYDGPSPVGPTQPKRDRKQRERERATGRQAAQAGNVTPEVSAGSVVGDFQGPGRMPVELISSCKAHAA